MLKTSFVVLVLGLGLYFLRRHQNGCEYTKDTRIDGKVVIVTGANTGIGKETAKDLALRGGKVYMACRSIERGQGALNDILTETGIAKDKLVVLQLDLSSFDSVRKFAQEFNEREKKLDLLVNNAAVWPPEERTVTNDGLEIAFATNHLGHFLLTHLLAERLLAASPSRVINVSAKLYEYAPLKFDDLMGEKEYSPMYAYSQSKTANNLFTGELARRIQGSGVTSYSLHPGVIGTEILRHMSIVNHPLIAPIRKVLSWPFMKDSNHGIQTTLYCSLEPSLDQLSGKYFRDCQEEELLPYASDPEIAKQLWDLSVQMVGLRDSEIHDSFRPV